MGIGIPKILAIILLIAMTILPVASQVSTQPAEAVQYVRVLIYYDNERLLSNVVNAGGKIVYKGVVLNYAVADIPYSALNALSNIPGLVVEPDSTAYTLDYIPWGLYRIGATSSWSYTTGYADINGDGDSEIEVAILDTGVDYTHHDLDINTVWCVAVLNGVISSDCMDGNGHGTHVAGTVAAIYNRWGVIGVAPYVDIYAIKVLADDGSGSFSDIAKGIELALLGPDGVLDRDGDGIVVGDPDDDAAEVISMSLGGYVDSTVLRNIIQYAYNLGVTIVAAAGNEGKSYPAYPAAYPEVIAVGAVDSNDNVPSWSNKNPEIAAPGVDILSTYPGNSFQYLSGTSMATPHVSAVVALIDAYTLRNYGFILPPGTESDTTPYTIRGLLHITADDLYVSGPDYYYGWGVVRADKAIQALIQTFG